MKNKLIFGLFIISLFLISGCNQQNLNQFQQEPICKSPYIEYKIGECCLDQNYNSICDNDEPQQIQKVESEKLCISEGDGCLDNSECCGNMVCCRLNNVPNGYCTTKCIL